MNMWTVALIFNSGVGFILLSTPITESVQAEVALIGFLPNPFVHGVFLVSSRFLRGLIRG